MVSSFRSRTAGRRNSSVKPQWRDNNRVSLLINGDEFFPRVFEAIRHAQEEVILETFILWEDKVGEQLQAALIDAAKRGVRVDFTVDDFGTMDLSEPFVEAMTNAGVRLHLFDPTPNLLGLRLNMFRRLHRKLVVIDGKLAFVGGINYCADQLSDYGPMAKQDYAVEVEGPVVADIHKACVDLLQQGLHMKGQIPATTDDSTGKNEPCGDVQALLALRDNQRYRRSIEDHYLNVIRNSKQRLFIANAYFLPGYHLLRAIRNAAQRGVKVTLVIQGQPDMPWVTMCSRLLYGYLMRAGVTIYEYCQRPLHGKVAVADDHWVTVGSSNLDPLSLSLNLEANLMINNREFNEAVYQHLTGLVESHCKPVNMKTTKRGYWWRAPLIVIAFHFLRYFPKMAGWLPAHTLAIKTVGKEDTGVSQ